MHRHVFITPAGLTHPPCFDTPEPEYLDFDVFKYPSDEDIQQTIDDLIELNQNEDEGQVGRYLPFKIDRGRLNKIRTRRKNDRPGTAG